MYSNEHDASRVETSSARVGPVTYGGDNELQRQPRQSDASQDEPYNRNAPSRDQVRAAARGQQGPINFDGQPPTPITTPHYQDGNVRIDFSSVSANDPNARLKRNEILQISTGQGDDNVSVERSSDGGILAHVNGQSYQIPFIENSANQQRVLISTGDGKDAVNIDYGGDQDTIVDLGRGNDSFMAGQAERVCLGAMALTSLIWEAVTATQRVMTGMTLLRAVPAIRLFLVAMVVMNCVRAVARTQK